MYIFSLFRHVKNDMSKILGDMKQTGGRQLAIPTGEPTLRRALWCKRHLSIQRTPRLRRSVNGMGGS